MRARAAFPCGANGMSKNIGPPMTDDRMIVRPTPSRSEIRLAVKAASNGPRLPSMKASPMACGLRCSSRRAKTRRTANPTIAEEVEERRAGRDVLQIRVAKDVAEALLQLYAHLASRFSFLPRRLGLADRQKEERRAEEAERVDQDRRRRLQPPDEDPREPWPSELRGRSADLELRVPVDDLCPLDERRKVRLVGDVEEDGRDPDAEADGVELPDRQRVEEVGDRNRCEQTLRARGHRRSGSGAAADDRPRRPRGG